MGLQGGTEEEEQTDEPKEEIIEGPQPLKQLITCFSRAATTAQSDQLEGDYLYINYANIMGQVRPVTFTFSQAYT